MTSEPGWVRHALWWQVYPLGFVGAPIRPSTADDRRLTHRLPRLEGWLDHVAGLGLDGLLLGPVFASQSHGYDTVDHFRIDPRLGDDADFDRLVAAARERGIRVLLDGVFNHVGRAHPAFRALEEEGPRAGTADLFRVRWDGWTPGRPVDADVFEGHEGLVALDHASPAAADLVTRVMTFWLDRGIDGWRLDAAYAVPPAFWAQVLPRVRETHPQAWFLGEVIHGDYAAIVEASTIDALTQYELWQGIWHGIADRNLFELSHALGRHDALLRTFVPATFVGNHDVTRIASAVDPDLVPHAVAVLLTVAGTPTIYAGDDLGLTGVKEERLGGDDAVRPELPDRPPPVEALSPQARAILDAHHELVALRRGRPWLHRAHTDVLEVTNTAIVLRTGSGEGAVVTALNVADEPVTLRAADGTSVAAGAGSLHDGQVTLSPRGWAVLAADPH
ncbi:Glycosidase [Nostocoides japonicum T1-X7]|uniref:Glycosidase n=1 Tax=Nostocoides japonicum T1-X7 TaxID=1194083 RepID=A0A077LV51_9MICO|nr:alpha-amylase family protein [Tetrasphaera japonica]CCH77566.1 Glycosidase [Tetrasphaera japonica T1-X7]